MGRVYPSIEHSRIRDHVTPLQISTSSLTATAYNTNKRHLFSAGCNSRRTLCIRWETEIVLFYLYYFNKNYKWLYICKIKTMIIGIIISQIIWISKLSYVNKMPKLKKIYCKDTQTEKKIFLKIILESLEPQTSISASNCLL